MDNDTGKEKKEESEDDPVVKELDVYLSKSLQKNLYVFQYASKPAKFPFDDKSECLSAKVKPLQQKVELEFGLDCESQNYDYGKGEQIVLNMKGNEEAAKSIHGDILDRQVFTSSKKPSGTDNYAIGLLTKGEIHLTPLHSVVQLRPSFNYLDSADNVKSGKKDSIVEEEEEEEPQAITVKFAGTETEKSKAAKQRSFHFIQQKSASEPWIHTDYYPAWSEKSSLERELLRCAQTQHDGSDMLCSVSDFVDGLVPNDCISRQGLLGSTESSTSGPSDRIKSILINAKVVKFEQLVELLKPIENSVILRLIQPIAVLVQGCWVIKSEILYPKDTFSSTTNVPAEFLSKCRDFVVWKFVDNPYFNRNDIPPCFKLPPEDWKKILTDISSKQSDGTWKFRYDFDENFVKNFPDVVQRQKLLWSARSQMMNKIAVGASSNATNGSVPNKQDSINPSSQTKRPRRKSVREDSPQKNAANKESKTSNDMDVDGPLSSSDLMKPLTQIIKTHHCLSLSQLRNLLSASNKNFSDKELEDAVVKVNGVFRLSNKWPLNASEEPIYGLIRVGDSLDKLREALLDLFSKTARIRISTFQKKVEDELGGKSNTAEANCKKILNEFCVLKAGFHYMKGTVEQDT